MKNRLRWVVANKRYGACAGVGAIVAAYAISPFLALCDIDRAVSGNCPSLLAEHIDWTALEQSLKQQVVPTVTVASDDLPAFGSSFADSAISHAIDVDLSPATLVSTARQAMARNGSDTTRMPDWHSFHAHFVGLNRFEARIDLAGRPPLVLHMAFRHWTWKITRLEITSTSAPLG